MDWTRTDPTAEIDRLIEARRDDMRHQLHLREDADVAIDDDRAEIDRLLEERSLLPKPREAS